MYHSDSLLLILKISPPGIKVVRFIWTRVYTARCVRGYIVVDWNWNDYEINYYLQYSQSRRQTISKVTICIPESLDPFDSLSCCLRLRRLMIWLRMSLHDEFFLLKLKSHDLFFPPQVVEAISQLRTIMNSNSLLHATEDGNQTVWFDCLMFRGLMSSRWSKVF